MEKSKLLVLFSFSMLSIYAIAWIDKLSATDSLYVPERQITPPVGTPGNPALTVYMLQTSVEKPTPGQLSQIQAGTFSGPVCPSNPDCGTPNTSPSKVGSSNCPTVCYAEASVIGSPPGSRPFNYPSCPEGYAVITPGVFDLYYQWLPAASIYPSSVSALDTYRNSPGYTCAMDPSTNQQDCPSGYDWNQYYLMNGRVYAVQDKWCKLAGSCWGDVSCGVAHSDSTNIQAYLCTRPAGYYPMTVAYGSTAAQPIYQMMPVSLICGLVNTQWVPG